MKRVSSSHQPRTPRVPDSPIRRHIVDWPALAIVALALIVRFIVLAQLGGDPLLQPRGVLDDAVFVRLAERVASGDLALGPGIYFLSPFYAYFLGLIFFVTHGSIFAARAVQAVLGAAASALVIGTARMWFGRRASLIAGVLAALTGIFAFNEILILQSALDPFLTALALFALARALRSESAASFVAAGIALAALVLNRPNALACLAAIPVVWVAVRRSRWSLVHAAALLVGASVLLGPVVLRNRIVGGEWVVVTSHGGLNFYIGNGEGADGTWRSVEGVRPSIDGQAADVQSVASLALGRPASASDASSYFYGLAFDWIRAHPGEWLTLLVRKFALTFTATDLALNYSYTYYARDESTLLSALVVGPWLIIPLGLFGLASRARRELTPAYVTWVSFVPVYALTLIAFFVSSRYRLALLVPLLAGSGAAADWLWTTRRALRAAVPALAAVAALFGLVNWPVVADEGRMNERMERIVWLVASGDVQRAKALLADTEPRHPNRALLLYRVGLAFREKGDTRDAVEYLSQAEKVDPRSADIRLALGEALVDEGRGADAIPHLEAARAAGVEPATASYDLARAFQIVGDTSRARAALASIPISSDLSAQNLVQLGMAALQLDDPAVGERFLAQACKRDPRMAAAHRDRGVALGMLGRGTEAAAELEQATRLDPSDADAHYNLALLYAADGRTSDARREVEQALRLAPDHRAAHMLAERLGRE